MTWFFFQGAEEVARETLIKNHFTQRIAELFSQVTKPTCASGTFVPTTRVYPKTYTYI